MDYIITAYGPVLLLCVLRKRKTKDMSARLVIIIPSNLLSQYSIFNKIAILIVACGQKIMVRLSFVIGVLKVITLQ